MWKSLEYWMLSLFFPRLAAISLYWNDEHEIPTEKKIKIKKTPPHWELQQSGSLETTPGKSFPLSLNGLQLKLSQKIIFRGKDTKNILREKTISNVKEIKARNGVVLWVITAWDTEKDIYDDVIEIPKCHKILTPFLPLIPLWIFAVEIAKSPTVEVLTAHPTTDIAAVLGAGQALYTYCF